MRRGSRVLVAAGCVALLGACYPRERTLRLANASTHDVRVILEGTDRGQAVVFHLPAGSNLSHTGWFTSALVRSADEDSPDPRWPHRRAAISLDYLSIDRPYGERRVLVDSEPFIRAEVRP